MISKTDLFNVWYYKIIPLLMEYFYHDIKLVSEVITEKFFDENTGEIVQLSLKADENNMSEFEKAIIAIYQGES